MSAALQRSEYDVVVIGAGVIGLACAWRIAERGLSVLRARARASRASGASGVAAGMLAPVTEAEWGARPLLDLNLESRRGAGPRSPTSSRARRHCDRLPPQWRAGRRRRPRRRRGAAPAPRVPGVAGARRRVAGGPRSAPARARAVAARRRSHPRTSRGAGRPARADRRAAPRCAERAASSSAASRDGAERRRRRHRPRARARGAVVVAAGAWSAELADGRSAGPPGEGPDPAAAPRGRAGRRWPIA